jgi:hypothetical protein
MKKYIAVLGLSTILACGTVFAMNHSNKWNDQKTELNENTEEEVCDVCWEKDDTKKDALGHTQIKVTNNCSYRVTVSYEYWTDRWVSVEFGVDAGKESVWWPANSYRNFKCEKSEYYN